MAGTLSNEAAGGKATAGGVLAQCHGPGAVAVAVFALADESDVAAGGDLFFQASQVGTEVVIPDQAEFAVFEVGAQSECEFFFDGGGERDGFDFPAETFPGAFGELHTHAGGIDAGAFDLAQTEQPVE